MNVWEEMNRTGARLIEYSGREVTFRDKPVKVILGTNSVSESPEDGGMVYSSSFNVRFFSPMGEYLSNNPPKQGEKLIVYGRSYTIIAVTTRKPSPWIDVSTQASDL